MANPKKKKPSKYSQTEDARQKLISYYEKKHPSKVINFKFGEKETKETTGLCYILDKDTDGGQIQFNVCSYSTDKEDYYVDINSVIELEQIEHIISFFKDINFDTIKTLYGSSDEKK